jgi:tetratricopeptide (TPR) repeat protein
MKKRKRPKDGSSKEVARRYRERAEELFFLSGSTAVLDVPQLKSALWHSKRALLANPSDYSTLVLVGDIQGDLGANETAFDYYDQAVRVQPEIADAYLAKAGLLLYNLERPTEAEPLARKGMQLLLADDASDLDLRLGYVVLIDVYIAEEKFAQARAAIREALERVPGSEMRRQAAAALRRIGKQSRSA